MALDDLPIKLPHTVTKLVLRRVISSKQTPFPELSELKHLEAVQLHDMDIGDIPDQLPTCIKSFKLFGTTFSKDVSLAAFQYLHNVFMKDTSMSVAHLIRMMEKLEHMPKLAGIELESCKLSPMNEIDQIEQHIKSSPCFRLEKGIVLNADTSISLKCSKLGKIWKLIKGLKIQKPDKNEWNNTFHFIWKKQYM